MERPGRDDAAVVGGRADVVDRVDLGGERLGRGVGRLGRRRPRPRGRLRSAADRIGRSATEPERHPDVRQPAAGDRPPRSRQATAMTTLLIAWARRVPTFRKRASRPPPDRDPDPEDQLVRRERRPAVGDPEVARRDRPLAARPADDDLRVEREQDRQRVAGRRGVGDVPAERPPVLDLGRADRRRGLDERRAGARGRRRTGGCPCTSSARRG